MGSYKSNQPKANPPICWGCDRKLHGGGRFYVLVEVLGVDGPRPFHKGCAPGAVVRKHDAFCASCEEESSARECPKSRRRCGHHCNHSWSHDVCCWCGSTWGDETARLAAPPADGKGER